MQQQKHHQPFYSLGILLIHILFDTIMPWEIDGLVDDEI